LESFLTAFTNIFNVAACNFLYRDGRPDLG